MAKSGKKREFFSVVLRKVFFNIDGKVRKSCDIGLNEYLVARRERGSKEENLLFFSFKNQKEEEKKVMHQ